MRGTVHFKPSGRIQLLEAQFIKAKERGEEVFAEAPRVQTEAEFAGEALQPAERKDWLKDIWGKWPGDESVDEILDGVFLKVVCIDQKRTAADA